MENNFKVYTFTFISNICVFFFIVSSYFLFLAWFNRVISELGNQTRFDVCSASPYLLCRKDWLIENKVNVFVQLNHVWLCVVNRRTRQTPVRCSIACGCGCGCCHQNSLFQNDRKKIKNSFVQMNIYLVSKINRSMSSQAPVHLQEPKSSQFDFSFLRFFPFRSFFFLKSKLISDLRKCYDFQ